MHLWRSEPFFSGLCRHHPALDTCDITQKIKSFQGLPGSPPAGRLLCVLQPNWINFPTTPWVFFPAWASLEGARHQHPGHPQWRFCVVPLVLILTVQKRSSMLENGCGVLDAPDEPMHRDFRLSGSVRQVDPDIVADAHERGRPHEETAVQTGLHGARRMGYWQPADSCCSVQGADLLWIDWWAIYGNTVRYLV